MKKELSGAESIYKLKTMESFTLFISPLEHSFKKKKPPGCLIEQVIKTHLSYLVKSPNSK